MKNLFVLLCVSACLNFGLRADGLPVELFNGKTVNRLTRVSPSKGRIQLQSEGCPVEFRRVTLTPLGNAPEAAKTASGTVLILR